VAFATILHCQTLITSETISLMNQCMCLDDDLRQVTIQDMSQAIAHLGCSTIAEAQVELQWSGKDWKQQPSLCHRFLACTSRGMQIEWTAIQQTIRGTPQGRGGKAPPELRTHELEILVIICPEHKLDNTPGVREMLRQVLRHSMAGNSRKQGICRGGGARRVNLKWTGACFRIRCG